MIYNTHTTLSHTPYIYPRNKKTLTGAGVSPSATGVAVAGAAVGAGVVGGMVIPTTRGAKVAATTGEEGAGVSTVSSPREPAVGLGVASAPTGAGVVPDSSTEKSCNITKYHTKYEYSVSHRIKTTPISYHTDPVIPCHTLPHHILSLPYYIILRSTIVQSTQYIISSHTMS